MGTRTATDWAGNIAAYTVMIAVNTLSNTLPINGQTVGEISARYASPFTPAGFTFSIWGLIYLALLVFVIWQALPAQRGNRLVAAVSSLFKANCLLNSAWIVAWHYDQLALSMLIMLGILATLVLIYRTLIVEIKTVPMSVHLTLYAPFSIYTGWITVATIANASVLQFAYGLDAYAVSPVTWTLAKLAIAGAIGVAMLTRYRDVPFAFVIAWAAYGISAKQIETPEIVGAASLLSMLLLVLVARDGLQRLKG